MSSVSEILARTEQPWNEAGVVAPEQLEHWFRQLRQFAAEQAAKLDREEDLRGFRDQWLGRNSGLITRVTRNWLKTAPAEWKPSLGQAVNSLRLQLEQLLEQALERQRAHTAETRATAERVDVTLPGRGVPVGAPHPILRVMNEITDVFVRLGYSVVDGPEIETVYYNFEALNVPESHPARDDQDTFYVGPNLPGLVLRTHTSPMQIRTMEASQPPLRIVVPGRVYRRDAPDATHSPMFHQVEGLAVDQAITLGDLKGTLDHFAREVFGSSVRTRFRPSFFPFTEPSAEMDVSCIFCGGPGCRTCKLSGWIELLGCGMVHPELYRFVNYDPEKWSGFAFGMGVERVAMILYGVDDIQRFFSGDVRFLDQFRE